MHIKSASENLEEVMNKCKLLKRSWLRKVMIRIYYQIRKMKGTSVRLKVALSYLFLHRKKLKFMTDLSFFFYFTCIAKSTSVGGVHCVASQAMNSTVPLTTVFAPLSLIRCWKMTSLSK